MTKTKEISVAIYCRLSRDDENNNNQQSESIETQRSALIKEARKNDWSIYDIYIDDGYTGLNFDRPDFQRMKRDIEKGYIDVILVKNQGRIGRDNSGVDKFLNEYLIEKGVRCIGITDHLDNMNQSNKRTSQIIGLTNEWYSEEISKYVRFAQDTKRQDGKFIGSIAPYGYKKSPHDKNQLIIDEEVAHVVRDIFKMYIEGYGYIKITKTLNDKGVLCPSEYNGVFNYNRSKIKKSHWSYHTIRRILMNEVYIGNMVQKKSQSISFKSKKKRATHPSMQIKVENTHDPIIDIETFKMVQDMISKNKYTKPVKTDAGKRKHDFSGLLVCGDCGRNMRYRNDSKVFNCNTSIVYGSHICTPHYTKLSDVEEIVLDEIKEMARLCVMMKEMKSVYNDYSNTKDNKNIVNIQLRKVEKRIVQVEKLKKEIYEDYKEGILDKDEFLKMKQQYSDELEELENKQTEFIEQRNEYENKTTMHDEWENVFSKYLDIEELNREILNETIDKIIITEKDNSTEVEVEFKHANPFVTEFEQYKDNITVGWYNVYTEIQKVAQRTNNNILPQIIRLCYNDLKIDKQGSETNDKLSI